MPRPAGEPRSEPRRKRAHTSAQEVRHARQHLPSADPRGLDQLHRVDEIPQPPLVLCEPIQRLLLRVNLLLSYEKGDELESKLRKAIVYFVFQP